MQRKKNCSLNLKNTITSIQKLSPLKYNKQRKQRVNQETRIRYQPTMLIPAISERDNETGGSPRRPQHENSGDRDCEDRSLRQEQRHGRENHHRQHTVTDHAGARVKIQITGSTGKHVENHVQEDRRNHDPTQYNAELDFSGE